MLSLQSNLPAVSNKRRREEVSDDDDDDDCSSVTDSKQSMTGKSGSKQNNVPASSGLFIQFFFLYCFTLKIVGHYHSYWDKLDPPPIIWWRRWWWWWCGWIAGSVISPGCSVWKGRDFEPAALQRLCNHYFGHVRDEQIAQVQEV